MRRGNFLEDLSSVTARPASGISRRARPRSTTPATSRGCSYLNESGGSPGRKITLGASKAAPRPRIERQGRHGLAQHQHRGHVKPIPRSAIRATQRSGRHTDADPVSREVRQPEHHHSRGSVNLKRAGRRQLAARRTVRKGWQGFSAELDLSYPLRSVAAAIGTARDAAIFRRYGESILDYNRRLPSQLRLGLMFVR